MTTFNFKWLDIQHFRLQKKDMKEYQHEYYLTHTKPKRQQKALAKRVMQEFANTDSKRRDLKQWK